VLARPDGTVEIDAAGATDVERLADGRVVVARGPGRPFRVFTPARDGWRELEPLGAPAYDGGAIAVNPRGRVCYTTPGGYSTTTGSTARRRNEGRVLSYRLDAGHYRTRWGRLFVDACIPPGTEVTARFLTTDLDDVTDPVDPAPPARATGAMPHPEDTPPLPSRSLLAGDLPVASLFRRPGGREEPWEQIAADDHTETYETPVHAPPGRYLWLVLELTGTTIVSPRVAALRVERPGHQLLQTLPRNWSRDDAVADFTQRYLAPVDGVLHELDTRAARRAILLDPRSTPQETLPWLASFAGLVLDRRWSEDARRTLVAEAYQLFSRRGTRAALIRLLEIYLGRAPLIVEAWQLRGLGGAVLGLEPEGPGAPSVGSGSRASGTLGRFTIGGQPAGPDSYARAAHRFTVLVPGELTPEQREVVGSLLRTHRPAHTTYVVCELGSGMRVGASMRVALTAVVGPTRKGAPAVTGRSRLTDDGVLGLPSRGATVGEARVGTAVVG
jgi:phage tail-like protein